MCVCGGGVYIRVDLNGFCFIFMISNISFEGGEHKDLVDVE